MIATETKRSHLYEIDLVRALTALSVVGVHVGWLTIYLNTTPLGNHIQNAAVDALHFTREVFLSITAFVLVYTYSRRSFSFGSFWRKRGLGVLLPYLFWSVVYVWLNVPHDPWPDWLRAAALAVVTGTASYQLYFILLSLEFYLVLPWFLRLVTEVGRRHPWRLLAASGLLQAALFYVDFTYVQVDPFNTTPFGQAVNNYQASFLPLYQFYAILGTVAALHADRLRAFVRQHGRLVVATMAFGLGLLWLRFAWGVAVDHLDDGYAASVFQPVMIVYAAAVSLFLYWLGVTWASEREPAAPRGYAFWSLVSDASFGIYLIHPLILGPILSNLVPALPVAWPQVGRVVGIYVLTASLTLITCAIMLFTPGLSRLIGRPSVLGSLWARKWPRQTIAPLPARGLPGIAVTARSKTPLQH